MSPNNDTDVHEQENNALRSYLQRSEVRLSTMHRIGSSFIGGAGLLILLPVIMKDSMTSISAKIYSLIIAENYAAATTLAIPFIVIVFIPIYSIIKVLHDLTRFYFNPTLPDDPSESFHPRFSLTAIPFSEMVLNNIKTEIRKRQFNVKYKYFIFPPFDKSRPAYDKILKDETLRKIALNDAQYIDKSQEEKLNLGKEYHRMLLAFGLSGAYNRDLIDEVALQELSIIRSNIILRRLLMRYIKAILLIIWTSVIFFITPRDFSETSFYKALLENSSTNIIQTTVIILITTFSIWAAGAAYIVRTPIRWLYKEYDLNSHTPLTDPHMIKYESITLWLCFTTNSWCLFSNIFFKPEFTQTLAFYLYIGLLTLCLMVNLITLLRHYDVLKWNKNI